jgi:hypothetical protein
VYRWCGETIFLYREEFHFTRSFTPKRNLFPFRRHMIQLCKANNYLPGQRSNTIESLAYFGTPSVV